MRIHLSVGALIVGATVLGASAAWSSDLTGVWFGEQKCDRYDGRRFSMPFPNDVMLISQNGDAITVAALFIDGVFQLVYQGHVTGDAKEPDTKAQAAFTACGTTPTSLYQEVGRATKVELKKNGDGSFEATSIFLQLAQDSFPTDTGTCGWNYKRVGTTDYGVPPCDEIGQTGALQVQGAQSQRRP
jgi:hypothetical protein